MHDMFKARDAASHDVDGHRKIRSNTKIIATLDISLKQAASIFSVKHRYFSKK